MISGGFAGGGESSLARKSYVKQIHAKRNLHLMTIERLVKQLKSECPSITFSAKDARGVSQPHDDPLVVTLVVSNYLMHRIPIDNDNSAYIFYLPTFEQMGIRWDKLKPIQTPLVRFIGDQLLLLGAISLLFTTCKGERQATKVVDFLVVDYPLAYNAILGRLVLNRLRAVTSM